MTPTPAARPASGARDELGQTTVEYGLVLMFVVTAAILTLGLLGDRISGIWDAIWAAWPS